MTHTYIPAIEDEKLVALAQKIKPVVRQKGQLHFIRPVDAARTAFMWSPEPVEAATGLREAFSMVTYHDYGAPVFFKPSIKEVLAQLPEDKADGVVAFSTDISGDPATSFSPRSECHKATTTFYTGTLPETVKAQPVIVNGRTVPAP